MCVWEAGEHHRHIRHGGEWCLREALGMVGRRGPQETGSMESNVGSPLPMRAVDTGMSVY